MRVNPVSQQNNQSFRAVNMKYYKQAVEEIRCTKNVTIDWMCRLRYDICAKKIPAQDGIETLLAVKRLITERNDGITQDLEFYKNMLKTI